MNPSLTDQSRPDQANRGFSNKKIPRFVEGGSNPSIFSSTDMNVLVDRINCLLSMSIRRGATDAIFMTDAGLIIQIAYDKSDLSLTSPG